MTIEVDEERIRAHFAQCAWPRLYYGVAAELAKTLGPHGTLVEIGVAYGYHALNLLNSLPHWRYRGVDPYAAGYDDEDSLSREVATVLGETSEQAAMDRLFPVVGRLLAPFGDRAQLHRATSVEAAQQFPDNGADLIFIDGDHRYAPVKADLAAWWPKLRAGGIFCGDDYLWPDVKRACDEFVAEKGLALRLVGAAGTTYPIWVVQK